MEKIKQGWKKWASLIIAAMIVIIFYKMLEDLPSLGTWFRGLFSILMPFLVGILISYILYLPSQKIENLCNKTKIKWVNKKSRLISVLTTYIIFILLVLLLIQCVFPIIRDSITELIGNVPGYYEKAVEQYKELPEDSIFKNEAIRDQMEQLANLDIRNFLNISSDKIVDYVKNVMSIFSGIFDLFVAVIVSVYVLLQRDTLVKSLKKFARAIFSKEKYEAFNKYFSNANEVFFRFITSQLIDAIVVGILTTVAMLIMKVKYAALLGFLIGLFNLIPFIGAIIAVGIAIIITLITGGFGKALVMSIVVIILQQIDANIINPKIIGSSLKVSPLLVLFAVTIGGAYFGILGMFLGVPIAVVLKTILTDYVDNQNRIRDEEEKAEAEAEELKKKEKEENIIDKIKEKLEEKVK